MWWLLMAKESVRNRAFKERECAGCGLADQKELKKGGTHYCDFIVQNKKEPRIVKGRCLDKSEKRRGKK